MHSTHESLDAEVVKESKLHPRLQRCRRSLLFECAAKAAPSFDNSLRILFRMLTLPSI